jgi:hypothetical protein
MTNDDRIPSPGRQLTDRGGRGEGGDTISPLSNITWARTLKKTFVLLFLALDTMASPGNGFQTLLLDFFMAGDTQAV